MLLKLGSFKNGYYSTLFFLVFVVFTFTVYKKNNRNLMLLGAVALLFGFVGMEFMLGSAEGLEGV